MRKFFSDFKKFITKGNVVDMAVAVIIGAAFNKIVSSLVADVITPLISLATGNVSFTELKWILREGVAATETTAEIPALTLKYGQFIQYIIDFLIIGLTVFVMVKVFTKLKDSMDFNANMVENVQEKFNKGEELNDIEKRWLKRFKKHYPDKAPKTLEEQAEVNAKKEEPKKVEPTETEKLLKEILEEIKGKKESK